MRLQEVWRRYVNAVACIFLSSCRILCDFCLICAHLFRVSFCNSSLWEAGSWEGKIMIDALSHTLLHWDCLLDLYPSQTEQKKKKQIIPPNPQSYTVCLQMPLLCFLMDRPMAELHCGGPCWCGGTSPPAKSPDTPNYTFLLVPKCIKLHWSPPGRFSISQEEKKKKKYHK